MRLICADQTEECANNPVQKTFSKKRWIFGLVVRRTGERGGVSLRYDAGVLRARFCEKAYDGDEQRGADDRPDNRKPGAADTQANGFGQTDGPGKPKPENRADESKGDRDQASAPRISCNRLTQGAADSRHNEQEEEVDYSHRANR